MAARSKLVHVAMVVNADGLQVRRAEAFRRHLGSEFETEILVAPGCRELRGLTAADLVYVIDPGRRGFPAAVAGSLARRPIVVDVGDPQAPLYRALGRSAGAVAAGAVIDSLVARRARAVVVRGRELADILDLRVPWAEIPDGVDLERFRPGADGDLRASLGIPKDALVVGVVGSLAWASRADVGYGWDVVECLGELRGAPVWGLVVGDGDGLARLRDQAQRLGVAGRLLFPGHIPHEQVPQYVAAMDVCVSTQSNDAVGRGRTTAKLPEYLACDRYVLASAVGGAADVLPESMLLPYEGQKDTRHPARLAARLAELVPRQPELRGGVGTRTIAATRYAYPVLAERLAALLRGIFEARKRTAHA
jgi:glycosyltransferase involved in cell wall biosynthesis